MIHATCIGNLGRDAEGKTVGSGKSVTNFSLATKGRGKDGPTVWVDCSLWGARGESLRPYLVKGSKVAVIGTLSTREHNGKTYLQVDVQELELLGGKPESASAPARQDEIPF